MTQQINLYHSAYLRRSPALEPGALLGYATALVLVLVLGSAAIARSERVRLEGEIAAIETQIKAQQEKSVALTTQRAARIRDAALDAEVTRLEGLVRRRGESLAAISGGVLGSTGGFSGHMRALARQSVNGLWLTGFSIANGGNEVTLRGRMLNADLLPRFLGRLSAEKAFEGKGFKSLAIDQPKPVEGSAAAAPPRPPYLNFEIATLELVGGAPANGTSGVLR